mgnify:CR=1 FL=1|jgi:hypothetical protein
MKNVTINGKKYERDGETPVKLNNGSLVVHYNKMGDVLGAYIVTSFRDSKGNYSGQQTTTYCSLINLDNGYIAFEERASRSTTVKRVLSHLNKGDYYGQQSVKEGQYIEVYAPGDFKIDLSFDRKVGN